MKTSMVFMLMAIIAIYILGMVAMIIYFYIILLIFNILNHFFNTNNMAEDIVEEAEKKMIPNYGPVRNVGEQILVIQELEKMKEDLRRTTDKTFI